MVPCGGLVKEREMQKKRGPRRTDRRICVSAAAQVNISFTAVEQLQDSDVTADAAAKSVAVHKELEDVTFLVV